MSIARDPTRMAKRSCTPQPTVRARSLLTSVRTGVRLVLVILRQRAAGGWCHGTPTVNLRGSRLVHSANVRSAVVAARHQTRESSCLSIETSATCKQQTSLQKLNHYKTVDGIRPCFCISAMTILSL